MKHIKFFLRQAFSLLLNAPYFIASLFPKRNDLWLFGAWFGEKFCDNPKYVFLYSLKQPGVTAVWLTKNKKLYAEMKKEGLPVAYSFSLKGVWLQIRCGVVVVTHEVPTEFNAWLIASRVIRVQAYHGIPLKKIGYDDEKSTHTKKHQKIIQILFPYRSDHYDLVFAASTEDQVVFSSAFNVDQDSVLITGFPRNDVLFSYINDSEKFNNNDRLKRIIYMPTFRGKPYSDFPLLAEAGFDYLTFDRIFKCENIQFEIKLHPVQKLSKSDQNAIQKCSNIKIAESYNDIYEILLQYDILITDYSSIFFDFLLTNRPVYMAPFDISFYLMNDRSMYYEYSQISPSSMYLNWADLVGDIVDGGYDFTKYKELLHRFHLYKDGNSSQRSFEAILRRSFI